MRDKLYHVTFYLMTTGMDNPDKRDLGKVWAASKDGAIRRVLSAKFSNCREDWEFLSGCMTAKQIDEVWPNGVDPEGNFTRG